MAKLPKFTLEFNEDKSKWELQNDQTNEVIKRWVTKDDATTRGALRKAVGEDGGSVKIQKTNGRFQEERTYPKSADPKQSKG